MGRIIIVAVLALALFGLSFGGSYYINKLKKEKAQAKADESKEKEPKESPPPGKREGTPAEGKASRPPLVSRGAEFNPEADATVQQAARLQEQRRELDQREQEFRTRKKSLELIKNDIASSRDEFEKVRKELDDAKKSAEASQLAVSNELRLLEEKLRLGKAEMEEQKKRITEVDTTRAGNIRRASGISDTMNATDAAGIILSMADTGPSGVDTAALLLANMKERKAAEVLSQLPDRTLAAQLLEKMISLRQNGGTGNNTQGKPGAKPNS